VWKGFEAVLRSGERWWWGRLRVADVRRTVLE